MREHLFVASDGDLYDTRQPGWASHPLRARYRFTHMRVHNAAEFKATLRAGQYAWPGGYPLALFCDDGGTLCFGCALDNAREIISTYGLPRYPRTGWRVEGCDVNWEDAELRCDHCGDLIGSAYGES